MITFSLRDITAFLLFFSVTCVAQEVQENNHYESMVGSADLQPTTGSPELKDSITSVDALHLPMLTQRGTMPYYGYHFWSFGSIFNNWNLHEGLNVSLGASVFSTFGSGKTWSGAGFSQNISMMYAIPLNEKWSVAVGGYLTNAYWAHDTFREAGLTGVLDYRINDRWDAYLYAQKNLFQSNNIPLPLYDIEDLGDRIGLGVNYKVTPSFTIGVSIEERFYNAPSLPWNRGMQSNRYVENRNIFGDDIPKKH